MIQLHTPELLNIKDLVSNNMKHTTVSFESSEKDGEPFYPIPTEENRNKYHLYKKETEKLSNVIFAAD